MRRCGSDDNPVVMQKKRKRNTAHLIGDPSPDASASFNQQGFWENLLPIISALLPPKEKENPTFISVMSQINHLIDEEKHREKLVQRSTDVEDDQPQVNENIEEDAQKMSEKIGKMSIEEIQKMLEKYDAKLPSSVPVPDGPMKYDWVTEVGRFNSSTISLDIIWSTWGTPRHVLKQWQMQLESKFGRNLTIREINGLNVMLREIYNKKSDSPFLVKKEELKMHSKKHDTCAYKFTCGLSDLMTIKEYLHDDINAKLAARRMGYQHIALLLDKDIFEYGTGEGLCYQRHRPGDSDYVERKDHFVWIPFGKGPLSGETYVSPDQLQEEIEKIGIYGPDGYNILTFNCHDFVRFCLSKLGCPQTILKKNGLVLKKEYLT